MESGEPAAPVFGHGPIHRWLGIEVRDRTPERATVRMPMRGELLQEEGVLQGGIAAALADAACVCLVGQDLGGRHLTSIEFKLNFLAPGLPEEGELVATAEPVRLGRRVLVCRARVEQGDRALCEGLFTYLASERRPPAAG